MAIVLTRTFVYRFRSVEAYAVLLKLDETTRFVWPPAPSAADEDAADRRAAFGHLVEGLLRRELPEVYNAFTVSGRRFVRK